MSTARGSWFRTACFGFGLWLVAGAAESRPAAADEMLPVSAKGLAGTVSGRVTHTLDGAPLPGGDVFVEDEQSFYFTTTDEDGRYAVEVPAGTYTVYVSVNGYVTERYDDEPCGDSCGFPRGDPVTVIAGQETSGIDFALDRLGVLRGRVTDAQTGDALGFGEIQVIDSEPPFSFAEFGFPDDQGFFEVDELAPGSYLVVAKRPEYQGEALGDVPCSGSDFGEAGGGCPLTGATVVSVGLNEVVEGLDFALDPGGSLSGRVTESAAGAGMPSVSVFFASSETGIGVSVFTGDDGTWASGGLEAGNYRVWTRNTVDHIDEVYPNLPCRRLDTISVYCPVEDGEAISVVPLESTPGIDFELDLGGTITGKVTAASDGLPPEFATVVAQGLGFGRDEVAGDGTFEIRGLNAGTYQVSARGLGLETQVYDGVPCPRSECPLGDPVPVELGQTTPNIDFSLPLLGALSVRVEGADGEAIPELSVQLWERGGSFPVATEIVSGLGPHPFPGILSGSYVLLVQDKTGNYVDELYPDIPCWASLSCDLSDGGDVEIRAGETTELTVVLEKAGGLIVRAEGRLTGVPLDFVDVEVYDSSGVPVAIGRLLAGGLRFDGVPLGTYYAVLSGPFVDAQVFGGPDCDPVEGCDPLSGAPIEVVIGEFTRVEFDPRVVGCAFSVREFCSGNGRFRAVARWEDAAGASSYGFFNPLTSDSGTFFFFGAQNVEGVVKVLDACGLNDRFWVFAAGLTDVQVTLWATDLATQETRVYVNPQGRAFRPIQDTNAFATCSANVASPTDAAAGSPPASRFEPAPTGRPKACAPSSGSLCLAGGRFSVEVFFRSGNGSEQQAGAEFLTDDSGYFWFFDRDNVEILVKVLDACAFNERFWVFGAGLTDVEVRLRVTDTETGQVKEYLNTQGNAFEPVQDTAAFNTCL